MVLIPNKRKSLVLFIYKLFETIRISHEWYKFTKEDCLKYIDSMSRRIEAVMKSRREATEYHISIKIFVFLFISIFMFYKFIFFKTL